MFACRELLFPRLDFFFPGKSVGFQNTLDNLGKSPRALIDIIDAALVTFYLSGCIVAVFFGLCSYGELWDLLRWLITLDLLSCAFEIEDKWMAGGLNMEKWVIAFSSTAAVEAVDANVKAVVDRIEALSTVFSVNRLWWGRGLQILVVDMYTSHFVS
jgi:hypothetical protein